MGRERMMYNKIKSGQADQGEGVWKSKELEEPYDSDREPDKEL